MVHGAATQLRSGGIGLFSNHSITNFPQNVPVKKNENRVSRGLGPFGDDMDKSLPFTFLGHPVYCMHWIAYDIN